MTTAEITALVAEIRTDYQIPPYIADTTIERALQKCYARLAALNGADFAVETDKQGRTLLTNGVYYELNHRYEEFEPSWQPYILSWQLNAASTEDDDET